jgi:hypothetical protein
VVDLKKNLESVCIRLLAMGNTVPNMGWAQETPEMTTNGPILPVHDNCDRRREMNDFLAHALVEWPEAEGNYPIHFQHLKIKEEYCLWISCAMDRSTKSIPPKGYLCNTFKNFSPYMLQDIEILEGI